LSDTWFGSWQQPATYTAARNASKAVDFDALARAGQLAIRSVESLRAALASTEPVPGARLELTGALGRATLALDAPYHGWGGGDRSLRVDLAGTDTYLDDTAANLDVFHPVSAVVDLAGNDRYHPSYDWDPIVEKYLPAAAPSGTGRQAAGTFGVAVLLDAAG